jgi:hypothetical protein
MKKMKIILEFVRVCFVIIFFGGIFYFRNNKNLSEILIFTGVGLSVVYTILDLIVKHKKKQLIKQSVE